MGPLYVWKKHARARPCKMCMRRTSHFSPPLQKFMAWFHQIGPYLLLTVPIVWFKIGLKCPRSTIFSILGHLCPNFEIASSKCMNWVFVQYISCPDFMQKGARSKVLDAKGSWKSPLSEYIISNSPNHHFYGVFGG